MQQQLNLLELAIVIATKQQDPTLLSLEFLRYSGVVPEEWPLARQPIRTAQGAQVGFQNGVVITASPTQTVFSEPLMSKSPEEMEAPRIAQRYGDILKNMDYQGLGINFKGYIAFPGTSDGAHDYIFKTLLAPGSWQQLGTQPVRAGLSLVYTFERNRLNLTVQEAAVQRAEQERLPGIIFAGNFAYRLPAEDGTDPLSWLKETLTQWQTDLDQFKAVVEAFLPAQTDAAIPFPTANLG